MRSSFSIERTIALRILSLFLLVAAAMSLGCTGAIRDPSPSDRPASAPAFDATAVVPARASDWERAVHIFQAGDYRRAMDLFQMMASETGDQELSRKGLFGLAAARLALAQTPGDLDAALDAWKLWCDQAPMDLGGEDPRILTPFLERFTRSEEMQSRIAEPPPSVREPRKPSTPKTDKTAGLATSEYKSLLREKGKEIERLKRRLESREREVKRLRHQIEGLEEIHLKFQERKQETSTP